MSRPKLIPKKDRRRWLPVMNGLVASFAMEDCPRCLGEGTINAEVFGVEEQICPCANHAFQEKYSPLGDLARLKVQNGLVYYRP